MSSKIVISLLIISQSLWAQIHLPPTQHRIFSIISQAQVTIGDPIHWITHVDTTSSVTVKFPQYTETLEELEIKTIVYPKPKKISPHYYRHSQIIDLVTFTPGSYIIPSQNIQILSPHHPPQKRTTPPLYITVNSVSENHPSPNTIKDIVPPIHPPFNIHPALYVLVLILIICFISTLIYLKKTSPQPVPPLPLTPYEKAKKELASIQTLNLIQHNKEKEFYYRVSQCLRAYLEDTFNIHAPEKTTEECIEILQKTTQLTTEENHTLHQYLRHCDLVKYAQLSVSESDCQTLIQTTESFLDQTHQRQNTSES